MIMISMPLAPEKERLLLDCHLAAGCKLYFFRCETQNFGDLISVLSHNLIAEYLDFYLSQTLILMVLPQD